MKKIILLVLAVALCIPAVEAKKKNKKEETKETLPLVMTDTQKQSYALGAQLGSTVENSFLQSGIFINQQAFAEGITDALKQSSKLTDAEMTIAFSQIDSIAKAYKEQQIIKAKEAGLQFLTENKKDTTIKETASGLQYKIIKLGTGAKPLATDKVKVHYHGTTIDGRVFDSSVQRGEPIVFPLNQVIKGWTEGVQLMPVGSKFKFFIPYSLAYGERGAGKQIPPYATLIFEVELLEIIAVR